MDEENRSRFDSRDGMLVPIAIGIAIGYVVIHFIIKYS